MDSWMDIDLWQSVALACNFAFLISFSLLFFFSITIHTTSCFFLITPCILRRRMYDAISPFEIKSEAPHGGHPTSRITRLARQFIRPDHGHHAGCSLHPVLCACAPLFSSLQTAPDPCFTHKIHLAIEFEFSACPHSIPVRSPFAWGYTLLIIG